MYDLEVYKGVICLICALKGVLGFALFLKSV
jgi:hypothetical protein